MDERLKLNISDMLNRGKAARVSQTQGDPSLSTSVTYERYFQSPDEKDMLKTEDQQKIDDEKALFELKERLISWSPNIHSASGEREIDLERFLHLCCRSFRSAQRRFKRRIKKCFCNGVRERQWR